MNICTAYIFITELNQVESVYSIIIQLRDLELLFNEGLKGWFVLMCAIAVI